jgi:hypothetical protein
MKISYRIIFGFISLIAALSVTQLQAETTASGKALGKLFSETERTWVKDYYRNRSASGFTPGSAKGKAKRAKKSKKSKYKKGKGLPPGLAKRDTLPPGLAKQLQRGGTLPPGLAKRDLPADLESMFSPTLPGQKRMLVGDDVLLIDEATNRILDIIRGGM